MSIKCQLDSHRFLFNWMEWLSRPKDWITEKKKGMKAEVQVTICFHSGFPAVHTVHLGEKCLHSVINRAYHPHAESPGRLSHSLKISTLPLGPLLLFECVVSSPQLLPLSLECSFLDYLNGQFFLIAQVSVQMSPSQWVSSWSLFLPCSLNWILPFSIWHYHLSTCLSLYYLLAY